MRNCLLAAFLFMGCSYNSFAQTDTNPPADMKTEKLFDHSVGVQLNGLIRQVFNFNNSTTTTVLNPYLLTYNINHTKTGFGLRFGAGYNYNSMSTNDGITATTNKINDLQFRIGIEKAFKLSHKWSAGAGIDFVYNTNNDDTKTSVTSFDTTSTETKSVGSSYGGGPMAWLRYHVTDKVLIGTEASFYYTTATQKNTIDVVTSSTSNVPPFNPIINTTETVTKPNTAQGVFSSPMVFYLIVKF